MNKMASFEYVLKSNLDVISWDLSEAQIEGIAVDIVNSGSSLTIELLWEILEKNGVTELNNVSACEGLDFKDMMALLKAAQEATEEE